MSSWHSYSSSFNLGHPRIAELFEGEVVIEEKVDGSQFSFGLIEGVLRMRSKGKELDMENPERMFIKIVDEVKAIQNQLHSEWTYRGEFLSSPKHNTLAYDRIPNNYFVMFDIAIAEEVYLSYEDKQNEAARLGFETVPLIYRGLQPSLEDFTKMLERTSFLGGQKIEGVAVKNYSKFGQDKKILYGKFVSDNFKEIHKKDWKDRNPNRSDILDIIGQSLRTPARWDKAIQHLKERGELEGTPKDIGALMKEIHNDIEKEAKDYVAEQLMRWAWPQITRTLSRGFPEWYKAKLIKEALEK